MGTVAALAMAVELIRADGLKRPKPWHILAAIIALLATQSRGAWISAAVGLLIYLSIRSGARVIMILAPVVLSVALASSAIFTEFANALAHWSAGGDVSTLNGRTEIWQNALAAVGHNPMFGTGPRSFDLEFRADALGLGSLISSSNAHNQIIQTLVERGVLGLSVLVILLIGLFRDAFRAGSVMRAGLMAFLAVFISRFAVETPLYIATATLNGAVLLIVVFLITSASNTAAPPRLAPRGALPSSNKRLARASAQPYVTNVGAEKEGRSHSVLVDKWM
jgi:O-antigen ligase